MRKKQPIDSSKWEFGALYEERINRHKCHYVAGSANCEICSKQKLEPKKARPCLKCDRVFATTKALRICSTCKVTNQKNMGDAYEATTTSDTCWR